MDKNPKYIWVSDRGSFKAMLAILQQASSCIMDTEADSMHHYQEKLSLIQISVGKYHWLIDPLCKLNIKPLWKCKALKNITFHACDYDLRLLARFHDFRPESIYDTSIAAKLLGEKQTGLAALVEKYFGIKLNKSNQKADWTRRPLSPEMCHYAMLDTVYLEAIKELQCKKLEKLGRMEWLRESCETLLINSKKNKNEIAENEVKETWRIKGSSSFKPLELQLLRAIWNWRNKIAQKKDVASYRVLNPYLMLDIVKAIAKNRGKINEHNLPRLPRNIKGALLQSFIKELSEAASAPPEEFPGQTPRKAAPRTNINEDLREKLRELRNEKAAQLKIDSGLLAKQSQLNVLADSLCGNTWEEKFEAAEFMKWQKEIWKSLVSKAILPKTPTEFRNWAKEKLSAMSEESRAAESEKLLNELYSHPAMANGYVAAFYPTKFEPQIVPFLRKLANEGRLLLPRVQDKQKMEFVSIQNLESEMQKGAFGIMEPKPDLPISENHPAVFLVPGIVFGKDGTRIGHGAGYYDRYLSSFKGVPRLGIAYSAQIRNALPQNAMDMKMDEVFVIIPKNHDYNLDFGDKLLAFIRFVFKNQAEFRHSCLGLYAKFSPLWGGRFSSKEMTVNFSDGSKPINLCSPIVLAAGANKNGKGINNYANLGLGGITVGTATRNFRIGNTHKPRVGLDESNRLIHNSMGLNNDGVEKISERVKKQIGKASKNKFAVGISVAETPGIAEENRRQDLLETFSIAYKAADYLEVNVSCPNTGEDRLDLDTCFMKEIFFEIENFRKNAPCRKAVYAKLSPDLTDKQLLSLLDLLAQYSVNGIILGNTYPSEKLSYSLPALNEKGTSGGISGRVIYENTFKKTLLAKKHFPNFSIVACGGIDHGLKVKDLLGEGVDFVQVYSVFAFRWMAAQKMIYELDFK